MEIVLVSGETNKQIKSLKLPFKNTWEWSESDIVLDKILNRKI
jgi:hypothetical protein